jgi:hypothetical protein
MKNEVKMGGNIVFRIFVLAAFAAFVGPTFAGIVDISFPELTGDYAMPPDSAPMSRTTTFQFPQDVQSVDGLRLVLSGTWAEGTMICDQLIGPPDTTSYVPGLSMHRPPIPGQSGHPPQGRRG